MRKITLRIMVLIFCLSLTTFSSLAKAATSAKDYYNRGDSKHISGDDKGAIKEYTKVIELDPKYPNVYSDRGVCKYNLKDYEGAFADFSKAVEINPKDTYAFSRLQEKELKQVKQRQDERTAMLKAEEIEKIEKIEAEKYKKMDEVWRKEKEAEAEKETARLKAEAKAAKGYFAKAGSKFNSQDYKGAVEYYNKVIELDSKYPQAFYMRADSKFKLEDYKGAFEDFDSAIGVDPEGGRDALAKRNECAFELAEIIKTKAPSSKDISKAQAGKIMAIVNAITKKEKEREKAADKIEKQRLKAEKAEAVTQILSMGCMCRECARNLKREGSGPLYQGIIERTTELSSNYNEEYKAQTGRYIQFNKQCSNIGSDACLGCRI